MKRYKLVRIVGDRFFSANTLGDNMNIQYGGGNMLEYKLGEVTACPGCPKGVACYKKLSYADAPNHITETMYSFNNGEPVAILEVEPIGRFIPNVDCRYKKGAIYEGGINYPAVKVIGVVKKIGYRGVK